MIREINHQISTYNYQPLSSVLQPHQGDKICLKNSLNVNVVNVKNTAIDFQTLSKELSIFREIKKNHHLAITGLANIHSNQTDRLRSLGLSISLLSSLDGPAFNGQAKEKSIAICDSHPRNIAADPKISPAMEQRAANFINQVPSIDSPEYQTTYAMGLQAGDYVKKDNIAYDLFSLFSLTWNAGINHPSFALIRVCDTRVIASSPIRSFQCKS